MMQIPTYNTLNPIKPEIQSMPVNFWDFRSSKGFVYWAKYRAILHKTYLGRCSLYEL